MLEMGITLCCGYTYELNCIFNASFYMNIESDALGYFALSFVVASYPGKEASMGSYLLASRSRLA